MSAFNPISAFTSFMGGGGGLSASSTNVNRSVNVLGQNPGGLNDLNQLISIAQGPSTNGGYTGQVGPSNAIYGGMRSSGSNLKTIAIVAGIALVAYLALKD